MSRPIEDYGFIGNRVTGALVSRDGSIDWLCVPRFDSDACFCALLGGPEHGHWRIGAADPAARISRRYLPGTAILETTFETAAGAAQLIDFMPITEDEHYVDLVRIVRGLRGRLELSLRLIMRFGYGHAVPWVRRRDYGLSAVAGPDALLLTTPVKLHSADLETRASFAVSAGEEIPFVLGYHPSHRRPRPIADARARLEETTDWWRGWVGRCHFKGSEDRRRREAVTRSLITLEALTFAPTGGIVAAPTTSLPECFGGARNWDYRFCWIRDATLTLYALLVSGYREEALAWREWLLRASAGHPDQLQVMYGLGGERRLTEFELPWLPGYADSRPVRIGNGASEQSQLDVFGELMDAMHVGRRFELQPDRESWEFQKVLLRQLENRWQQPDEGIWEVRGGPRHFTHSRLMCWVAFDRAVRAVEEHGLPGPVEHWREVCQAIRADIERHGWNATKGAFVQYYGGDGLDASLLLMAQVGFLPAQDPRFVGTVAAIERELRAEGLVLRYRSEQAPDGLPAGEGAFLACSFWLADAYVLLGRLDDAEALFERLLAIRNDLGLLAEEYDPRARRQLGNFPQAFSHIALINTAHNLASASGPAHQRGR